MENCNMATGDRLNDERDLQRAQRLAHECGFAVEAFERTHMVIAAASNVFRPGAIVFAAQDARELIAFLLGWVCRESCHEVVA